MSVYRVPEGAVLLVGGALDAARYAVDVTQRARRRNGLPPSDTLAQLAAALTASASGQTDTEPGDVGEADYMTTDEAADQLGYSTRQVRRLASALGGQLIGGRWLMDRLAVAEHQEGTHP